MNKILCFFLFLLAVMANSSHSQAAQNINDEYVQNILQSEDESALDELIKNGLDVNSRDADGNTMLFYVLKNNDELYMARKLIEAGADVNAPSANGMTPLIVAVSTANELKLQKMMFEKVHGTDNEVRARDLQTYINYQMNRAIAMLQMLLEQGADINQETPMGTPLMAAATNDWNVQMIDLLMQAGADINQRDHNGRTALFYAYMFNSEDIENLLIQYGADVTIQDREGFTYMEIQKE